MRKWMHSAVFGSGIAEAITLPEAINSKRAQTVFFKFITSQTNKHWLYVFLWVIANIINMFKSTLKKKTDSERFYKGEYAWGTKSKILCQRRILTSPQLRLTGTSSVRKWLSLRLRTVEIRGKSSGPTAGPAITLAWGQAPCSVVPASSPLSGPHEEIEFRSSASASRAGVQLPLLLHLLVEMRCIFLWQPGIIWRA